MVSFTTVAPLRYAAPYRGLWNDDPKNNRIPPKSRLPPNQRNQPLLTTQSPARRDPIPFPQTSSRKMGENPKRGKNCRPRAASSPLLAIFLWFVSSIVGRNEHTKASPVQNGPSRASLRLGHATALTPHRGVIHYRGAASLRRPLPRFVERRS